MEKNTQTLVLEKYLASFAKMLKEKEKEKDLQRYYRDGKLIVDYKHFIENKNIDQQTKCDILETLILNSNYPDKIKIKLLEDIKNDLLDNIFFKSSENDEKEEKKTVDIGEILASVNLPKDLFRYTLSDYENIEEIRQKLSSLSLEDKKTIISQEPNTFHWFANQSKDLCIYALENNLTFLDSNNIPENMKNDLDVQISAIKSHAYLNIKNINLHPEERI